MKKNILIVIILIIILSISSSFILAGQANTPAENRFTGKCKVFNTTAIYPWYKHSNKCRAFWSIEMRFTLAKSHNKSDEDYLIKINQDKDIIEKLCSNLESKQQSELLTQYNVKSCLELKKLIQ